MDSEEFIGSVIYEVKSHGVTLEWTSSFEKAQRFLRGVQVPAEMYQIFGHQKVLLERHMGIPIHKHLHMSLPSIKL